MESVLVGVDKAADADERYLEQAKLKAREALENFPLLVIKEAEKSDEAFMESEVSNQEALDNARKLHF